VFNLLEERDGGEEEGEEVDAAHGLHRADLVGLEQLVLPGGSEGVAGHVADLWTIEYSFCCLIIMVSLKLELVENSALLA
jgi:hypothetical protein